MTESSTPYVLVVEDDHDVRETLADALREEGYRVGSAENGLAALEFLRTHTTQLVLLDLMMPVMDGWQFRTRQLADPALAHVPVVVISAHSGNNLVNGAHRLSKPIDLEELLTLVASLCGAPRS